MAVLKTVSAKVNKPAVAAVPAPTVEPTKEPVVVAVAPVMPVLPSTPPALVTPAVPETQTGE